MKRFILLFLTLITFSIIPATADDLPIKEKFEQSKATYSNKYSIVKFFQEHMESANKKDIKEFISFYAPEYITNDGFNLEVSKNIVETLWKEKTDIQYKNTVNSVSFYGDTAIANVTETATAKITNEKKQKGTLKSCSNVVYSLKRSGKSWIITSEQILTEEINMLWGDAKCVAMFMEAPHEVAAGSEYSAKLYIAPLAGIVAIGSISSEKISFPQQTQKDTFRKFAPDYSLERLLIANTDNTNEYAIASIMYSQANSDKNNVTGYACLIRRVNVVPKNNFIEVKNLTNETVKK